ncbi:MAG: phosphodiesterase [Clostridia bacterium]|nr:phosphodiesterase [Clostridia bacterium]
MKIMVASDIHGSEFYCEKLIDAYKREGAEKLLLLGDILYHGPRNDLPEGYKPKGIITMLNNMKNEILCVRGNCDTEVDQMVLEFPIMAEYAILYYNNRAIYATHGHIFNESRVPALNKGDILLNGHTHVPAVRPYPDYIYMNPGSVSIPKGGSQHSYMIFEDNNVFWKNLDGEIYNKYVLK